jgi:hypothetical protein
MAKETTTKIFGPFPATEKMPLLLVVQANTGSCAYQVEVDTDEWVTVATYSANTAVRLDVRAIRFRILVTGNAAYNIYGM